MTNTLNETRESVGVPRIPDINVETPIYKVNFTIVLSVLLICLTILSLIVKVFGIKKEKPENIPGNAPRCKEKAKDLIRLEDQAKNEQYKREELTAIVTNLEKEVAVLKVQNENMTTNMTEVKEANKMVANRLDDLLQQLFDWTNSN
jgi:uncharacterized protein YlxW (UPF0749 family)